MVNKAMAGRDDPATTSIVGLRFCSPVPPTFPDLGQHRMFVNFPLHLAPLLLSLASTAKRSYYFKQWDALHKRQFNLIN